MIQIEQRFLFFSQTKKKKTLSKNSELPLGSLLTETLDLTLVLVDRLDGRGSDERVHQVGYWPQHEMLRT